MCCSKRRFLYVEILKTKQNSLDFLKKLIVLFEVYGLDVKIVTIPYSGKARESACRILIDMIEDLMI